jgi:hypothetical protein
MNRSTEVHHLHKSLVLLALLGLLVLMQGYSGSAEASMCIVPEEAGSWKNYDTDTRNITRLNFRMECRDDRQTTCYGSICSTTFGVKSHYFINLWGKCHPSDCNWGEVEGVRLSGSLEGWYRFYYDQGFARRWVYVRTYDQWPGWLRLYVWTDFTDPNRADYAIDEWFVPN